MIDEKLPGISFGVVFLIARQCSYQKKIQHLIIFLSKAVATRAIY